MKKILPIAVFVLLFCLVAFATIAKAAPTVLQVDGGGTGLRNVQSNALLLGNGTGPFATSTFAALLDTLFSAPTGTTTVTANLHVGGNLQVDGQFFAPVKLVTSGDTTINGNLTATGAVTGGSFASSALGTVGAPVFSFSGDPNTGLWSPVADTLALSTAGAERFRVTSTGNVGIGTASPLARLHIVGANTAVDSFGQLAVMTSDTFAADVGAEFALGGAYSASATTTFAGIAGRKENSTSGDFAGYLQLFTSTNGSGNAERMRITSTGNVGIGTTSPWRKLSAAGTVGFDGLTASVGAGSLCLSSAKEVVYNAGSDNCLSSTRASKHDTENLSLGDFSVLEQLQPVSFIYNDDASSTMRFGFIAEDAAAADPHLATRNASGEISGLDTNGFLAVIVDALKKVISRQDDTEDRLEALEARLTALESENMNLRTGRGVLACMLPI